jgi:hypothetical protein
MALLMMKIKLQEHDQAGTGRGFLCAALLEGLGVSEVSKGSPPRGLHIKLLAEFHCVRGHPLFYVFSSRNLTRRFTARNQGFSNCFACVSVPVALSTGRCVRAHSSERGIWKRSWGTYVTLQKQRIRSLGHRCVESTPIADE